MDQKTPVGTAVLVGAGAPFGAEIAAALAAEGYNLASLDEARVIDVLVINTPVTLTGARFEQISDEQFNEAMATILFEPVFQAQAALSRMPRGGRIVLVASRGHQGAWGGAHLMAASAALAGMARSMALELSDDGLMVNLVAPDFVNPDKIDPASREVARAVAYFAAPQTGLLTAQAMVLDGARSLRMSESRRR